MAAAPAASEKGGPRLAGEKSLIVFQRSSDLGLARPI
jgi:hypothetical protein